MSDKSNALRFGNDLWQRAFKEVAAAFPEIAANHLYVDALTMQMVKDPRQFDEIVTCNMFGDIVTDLGAQLQGGLGMAASGNIHPGAVSMFEPVHGSAPKSAGTDTANPFGAILTAQMMLDHLGAREAAAAVERAVVRAIEAGSARATSGDAWGRRGILLDRALGTKYMFTVGLLLLSIPVSLRGHGVHGSAQHACDAKPACTPSDQEGGQR